MATLHVRNVPDPLYEALRRSADENGRSIGAQAIALLNESLSTNRRGFPFFGSRTRGSYTPFQAFSDEARALVVDAQAIVRELQQDHVGTEHLLYALTRFGEPLGKLVSADDVRARLERGAGVPEGAIPFTPNAKKALEIALRESLRTRSPAIEPTHLALGVTLAEGRAATILAELGVGIDDVRIAAVTTFRMRPAPLEFQVVELSGSPDDWQEQLNQLATDYQLVQIVDRRAVFRRRE